jgi:tetratricopeptide (TPR) repeat protein
MNSPELKKLIDLLDFPDELKLIIEKNRSYKDLDESIRGFIAMYDSFDGDCNKLRAQISSNKKVILRPLDQTKQVRSSSMFLKYAAMFALVIGSSFFTYFYFSNDRVGLAKCFNDPGIPNFMSAEENNEMIAIMFYYQKKEYEKADVLIQSELKHKPANDTLNYYASVVMFLDERGDSGFKGFERLGKGNGTYKAKSIYYQGLIYVNQGDNELAISCFKEVLRLEDEAVSLYAKAHIKQLELNQKSK